MNSLFFDGMYKVIKHDLKVRATGNAGYWQTVYLEFDSIITVKNGQSLIGAFITEGKDLEFHFSTGGLEYLGAPIL